MAIKKINTDLQIEAGLLDGDGDSGTSNQILISTGTGVDWVDGSGSSIIGGPYLPLVGGTMTASANINMNSGTLSSVDSIDFGIGQLNGVSTSNLILKSLGDITYNVDSNNNGNSSHIFQESGSELMRIRYDGNVGIGTTSPERALHIDANGARPIIQIDKGGDKIFSVGTGTSANDDDNTILQLFDEGTEKIRLFTVGDSFFNGGNVGIGTTSPGAKLDVDVTGNNTALKLTRDGGVNGFFDIDFDGANTNFNSFYAYTFQTNNTERMRITSGGNVGIGTTSPTDKLDVIGNATFSGNASNQNIKIKYGNGAIDYGAIRFYTNGYNHSTIHSFATAWQGNDPLVSGGSLNLTGATATTIGDWNDPDAVFRNGGATYLKNNVGIGTTSPSQKLDVAGNVVIPYSSGYFMDTVGAGASNFIKTVNSFETVVGTDRGSAGFGVFGNSNIRLGFGTAYTTAQTKLTILPSGNVGIGATDPNALLHVYKSSHPNAMLARFENPTGEGLVEIKSQNDALSILQFADSEDGNVGAVQYSHVDNSMRF